MNKLADEAAYFGAVADGVESQQEKIANLEKQLADKQKELADLTTERDTFYMTYRITCDEDTKKLEQQLAEFKHGHEVAELKAMFAELDRVATHNYAIKDAEIAELREQLANALAANEHNLKVYHAAAAELRQQLSDLTAERDKAKAMPMKYRRMEFNAQLQDENESLRQQLAATETRREGVKQQRDTERASYLNEFEKNQVLIKQLADSQKQVTLLRDALEEATALARNLLSDAEQQVVEEYTEAPKVFKICDAALAATEPKP